MLDLKKRILKRRLSGTTATTTFWKLILKTVVVLFFAFLLRKNWMYTVSLMPTCHVSIWTKYGKLFGNHRGLYSLLKAPSSTAVRGTWTKYWRKKKTVLMIPSSSRLCAHFIVCVCLCCPWLFVIIVRLWPLSSPLLCSSLLCYVCVCVMFVWCVMMVI